ncbi:MAG: glycerate kinase [Deltaproteobacteria bacterium]|nr:glycerate kinase [Deltaproteobacteria bacterium]
MRDHVREIFSAGLAAADPLTAIPRHVELRDHRLMIGARSYDLDGIHRILVIGCGKAAARMALALQELLGDRIFGGVVVVKYGHGLALEKIKVIEAGHPIPDRAGLEGARQVMEIAAAAGADDLILFVVSGGGSALLPMPAIGLTLKDKQLTTELLLGSGATIQEINALRKHLSQLKGGRLAQLATPARLAALLLSDVVGDDLDAIASGPSVGDPTTFADCLEILRRYRLLKEIPRPALALLERGARGGIGETPKPSDGIFHSVQNLIVGSNALALAAAKERAQALGYRAMILSSRVQGESRDVAKSHMALVKTILSRGRAAGAPLCLISGGETTVTLRGDGLGGRNQEFALAAAVEIAGIDNVVVLSAGTDGGDGPTDAAGAIVDGFTLRRGATRGLRAADYLARNDSYSFLQATDDLLITGPTFTNVMDVQLALLG